MVVGGSIHPPTTEVFPISFSAVQYHFDILRHLFKLLALCILSVVTLWLLCPSSNLLNRADSLATVGGPMVVVTPVRSPPGPSPFLLFYILYFLFILRGLGQKKFFPAMQFLCTLAKLGFYGEFLRGGDGSKTTRVRRSPKGITLGESEIALHCTFTVFFPVVWPLDWLSPPPLPGIG